MSSGGSQAARKTFSGTVRVFLGEALILPTGILTAAFLTRRLGPADYGLLSLAMTLATWLQWTLTVFFARAAIQAVSESDDWRPVGAVLLRLHVALGLGAAVLLALLASPLAAALQEPALAGYLWLLAPDIVLSTIVAAHRHLLVGMGHFSARAVVSAIRWVARLLFIVVLVQCGASVAGAVLGNVLASVAELLACRRYVRPGLALEGEGFPLERLWRPAIPLFLSALSFRLFDKLDLFALKLLGGTAADAGLYVAAQNLAFVPSLVSMSFSPLLLSTLCGLMRRDDPDEARALVRRAVRGTLWLLPLGAVAAASAREIVGAIYGPQFAGSGPIFALLVAASLALVFVSVYTAVLTAAGKHAWTVWLSAPLLPVAGVGYLLSIPRGGVLGAALVTLAASVATAGACGWAAQRVWRCDSLGRSLLSVGGVTALAGAAAALWPAPGWLLIPKLALLALGVLAALCLCGEITPDEQRALLGPWTRRRAAALRGEV